MELVFNELSFLPYQENEVTLRSRFLDMLRLFEVVRKTYGFNHIVFPSNIGETYVTSGKTFLQWAYEMPHGGEKNKVLGFIKTPFGNDILESQVMELCKYYYSNEEVSIKEKYCIGLAISYLKDKVSISLSSNACWSLPQISFKEIIDDELNTKDVIAYNITIEEHTSNEKVKKQLMYAGTLELKKCPLTPDKKTIKLSGDHHGNDKLEAFAKKLFKNDYVESVINNIEFSPKSINLIKNIYQDGKIEIVLYWESAGYGMLLQTTGRNYRETEAIANQLKKEFDR
jgi:hypothetical protein